MTRRPLLAVLCALHCRALPCIAVHCRGQVLPLDGKKQDLTLRRFLTVGRSIAVDPQSIPYGTPVWLDTTEPLNTTPLRRAVMAQDTGSAITGAVRADYFWGWGGDAEARAGRMKQPLRLWVLWPRLIDPGR